MSNLTPLMKQYWDIKSLHSDKVLLFRMGDFFEIFHDDAVRAAPIVGITLTSRNKKSADETPMCGVPHHSIAGPINKLLAAGLKIAICDQIEDPKLAKGLVKRAVTRILTPGMVYDSDTLTAQRPHYMASTDGSTVAFVDTTSGEAFFVRASSEETISFLRVLEPVELVLSEGMEWDSSLLRWNPTITRHESLYDLNAVSSLENSDAPVSVRRLLSYCHSLSGAEMLQTLRPFEERQLQKRLHMSSTVVRHLELFETYQGQSDGSFLNVIDRTKTSGGRRLLRSRLCFPFMNLEQILGEQERVKFWSSQPALLKKFREGLVQVGDLERRVAKIASPQCNARDLLSLGSSLLATSQISQLICAEIPLPLEALAVKIEKTLMDDAPLLVRQGYMIKRGVSEPLDEWVKLSTDSHQLLAEMEEREKKASGISSLKIRYNNVFGYYIEVTHTHKDKVPAHYMRKQTLANAERFYTSELMELEKKVLSAQTRRFEMEYEIFENLRKESLKLSSEILKLASEISAQDISSSMAWLGIEKSYALPTFTDASGGEAGFNLRGSRHPVGEAILRGDFVANDIQLDAGGCLLITGPNMAGKSTLMRQLALTVIMAQIGAPVPATAARMPILESIFTRIGASDQLSAGLSTFMVEMQETAEMLERADERSLVILDEVGRGTSTYDGLSLAQAILEFLVQNKKAYTLFATHYHELTKLEQKFAGIHNYHMAIGERSGEIRFLHLLKRGPAGKSYGIHVAKLAGLPKEVTQRAASLLKTFESTKSVSDQLSLLDALLEPARDEMILEPAILEKTEVSNPFLDQLLIDLQNMEVSKTTPLQALGQIAKWQEILSSPKMNS